MKEARPRPSRFRPPGAVKDCMTCRYWTPGTIILRGSTQGICTQLDRIAGADEWCDMHDEGGA